MDLYVVVSAVALVGILVFVHEFGHFFFAKLFGVGVKVFSLGFGRRLFGFYRGGTDYRVSLLPIGGYVLMEGADPFVTEEEVAQERESETSLLRKPIWQRLIIVSAGPLFNLGLPVVVFTALFMAGEPKITSVIGTVEHLSLAAEVGLESGDRVLAVDGVEVSFWSDFYDRVAATDPDRQLRLSVDGETGQREISLSSDLRQSPSWQPSSMGLSPLRPDSTVGVDDPASPAGTAGFQTFDRVLSVDGQLTEAYDEVLQALASGTGEAALEIRRQDGSDLTLTLDRQGGWIGSDLGFEDPLANSYGLYPATLFVAMVTEDSAASAAGIREGDRIAGIDGVGLAAWSEVTRRVGSKQRGEGEGASSVRVGMTLVRDGRVLEMDMLPEVLKTTDVYGHYQYRAMIGIGRGGDVVGVATARRYYSFGPALGLAWKESTGLIKLTLGQVGKLVTGKAAPSKTLGGPVQIFRDAGRAAREGIFTWARLMALLSISLGIINFLPVPVLDGGQFLFFTMEGLRGRPVSLRVRERLQQVGVLAIVALMLTVLAFDLNRWIAG